MSNSNIEFVTRPSQPSCDSCGRPTRVGFEALVNGTPVLFDCDPCARRTYGNGAVEAAIEVDRQRAFTKAAVGGLW
jgi:hypothetical protein